MEKSTPHQPISDHDIAVSNMIEISALVKLLIRKGVITHEKILEEVKTVQADMLRKIRVQSTEQCPECAFRSHHREAWAPSRPSWSKP